MTELEIEEGGKKGLSTIAQKYISNSQSEVHWMEKMLKPVLLIKATVRLSHLSA